MNDNIKCQIPSCNCDGHHPIAKSDPARDFCDWCGVPHVPLNEFGMCAECEKLSRDECPMMPWPDVGTT